MSDRGIAKSSGQAQMSAPYPRAARKRLPNASSSNLPDIWEDAESPKPPAHDDALGTVAAEIQPRTNLKTTTTTIVDATPGGKLEIQPRMGRRW